MVARLVAQLDVVTRCIEQVCDEVQRTFLRVCGVYFGGPSLRVRHHLELLKPIKMPQVVHIETCRCLPLLVDMKVHCRLCKMMFGQCYQQWDVGQLLLPHPLVYGVWYPYRYAVTIVYRLFQPLFKLVQRVDKCFKFGDNVHLKLALLQMGKSVLGLVMPAKDIRGRLNTRLQHLEGLGVSR